MRLSHKYKFLYIAPPKTGSTTIRAILDEYSDVKGCGPLNYNEYTSKPPYVHSKARDLRLYFKANNWDWDDYYKFSFARNPWARQVSTYTYHLKRGFLAPPYMNFRSHTMRSRGHAPCSSWFDDCQNRQIIDFAGRLENLQEDFNTIFDKIGIPRKELPHRNKTKHKHYTEYYDDESRDMVAKRYAKDIRRFGYKFIE